MSYGSAFNSGPNKHSTEPLSDASTASAPTRGSLLFHCIVCQCHSSHVTMLAKMQSRQLLGLSSRHVKPVSIISSEHVASSPIGCNKPARTLYTLQLCLMCWCLPAAWIMSLLQLSRPLPAFRQSFPEQEREVQVVPEIGSWNKSGVAFAVMPVKRQLCSWHHGIMQLWHSEQKFLGFDQICCLMW